MKLKSEILSPLAVFYQLLIKYYTTPPVLASLGCTQNLFNLNYGCLWSRLAFESLSLILEMFQLQKVKWGMKQNSVKDAQVIHSGWLSRQVIRVDHRRS